MNFHRFDFAHNEREREREREELGRRSEKERKTLPGNKKFQEILHLSRIMLATMLQCIVALSCSLAPSLVKHQQKFPSVFIGCLMQQIFSSAEECRAF
jgi:hypothetical protein